MRNRGLQGLIRQSMMLTFVAVCSASGLPSSAAAGTTEFVGILGDTVFFAETGAHSPSSPW
jgi:hypothetical protein